MMVIMQIIAIFRQILNLLCGFPDICFSESECANSAGEWGVGKSNESVKRALSSFENAVLILC